MRAYFQRWFGQASPRLKTNRKLTAVVVCLLVSATFWFLIALAKEYPTRMVLPVVYQNFPGKKVVMNELPSSLTLALRTSGYTILSYGFGREKQPLVVDVSALLASAGKQNAEGRVTVSSSDLATEISGQLGSSLTITSVSPDSLTFQFGSRSSKVVPVHVNAMLSFERQFDSLGTYSLMPHEVEITGPASILESIRYVETDTLVTSHTKGDVREKLKLQIPSYVDCSTHDVLFFVPVEKYTEGSVEIPVRTANVRNDLSLRTFPDKVRVRFLVPLSKYAQVKPGQFDAVVNAADVGSGASRLRVNLTSIPDFVRSVAVDPEHVEFILRKK